MEGSFILRCHIMKRTGNSFRQLSHAVVCRLSLESSII